ncbi:hypothetical protein TNIN_444481 [Trichonephila inaurata madagascariensis]|uniref:Uncharacterized protein n=1 Tax=Trichonephila inaurata madagascariensis TaxID=2747483 RepID=A0A8X7BWT1_9ARAC|nr:hypothetical protein TNIN_446661 [Trichonephila inaurata madagascariensis]GFY47941.1 hypothetical protein TNIN_444481 [Trichonephila inaurata madagascariensis]
MAARDMREIGRKDRTNKICYLTIKSTNLTVLFYTSYKKWQHSFVDESISAISRRIRFFKYINLLVDKYCQNDDPTCDENSFEEYDEDES